MKFVSVTEDDFEAISQLVSTPAELYQIFPRASFPLDTLQLQKLMTERHALTAVIENGKLIAFANLYNVQPGISAFIGNVVVAKAMRGRGVGRSLINYMNTLCINQFHAIPHLSVFNFNTAAILLYSKLGFTPYAVEARVDIDNNPVALLHLKLEKCVEVKL